MAAKKKTEKPAELAIQPEINIGLVGHVDHGKTTLTEKLSGKWTDTHSEEIKRGITIRLGYADAVLRKCPKCPSPQAYTVSDKCPKCGSESKVLRKISLVDAPGHESLMATMLAGAAILDAALLLVAANEDCPQPQTREHLMALQIVGIKNVIVIQNKIDLVSEEDAVKNYNQIKELLKGTEYANAPIIPMSARLGINVDSLIEAIEQHFPTPQRNQDALPFMFVARSFDINKPGTEISKIVGGVLGGALKQGLLKKGETIEIKPGYKVEERNKLVWKPMTAQVLDLKTGGSSIEQVGPGGSIGIMTSLDPSVVKSDQLSGSVVGHVGKLPPVWYTLDLEVHLLDRVVGAKEDLVVEPIKKLEMLMLNVNSAATVGIVYEFKKDVVRCNLKLPVCAELGSRVTISRRIGTRFRLIGFGIIKKI